MWDCVCMCESVAVLVILLYNFENVYMYIKNSCSPECDLSWLVTSKNWTAYLFRLHASSAFN